MPLSYPEALRLAWPVLMDSVRTRRTISYSELAGRAGQPLRARSLHKQLLNPLAIRCKASGRPDLCALVVRKDSGLPGLGWFEPASLDARDPLELWAEAVLACYEYTWPARPDRGLLGT